MKQLAALYSGGTDSTAAVLLTAAGYERVHLVTFKHAGLRHVDNSAYNLPALREKVGAGRIVYRVIDINRLFRRVTYEHYPRNLFRFGLFNLTTCGLCKLAMHLRMMTYCFEHGVTDVIDGANRNMSHFPDQMPEYLEPLRALYAQAGIHYFNPVYDYTHPDDIDWIHKLGLAALGRRTPSVTPVPEAVTTGRVLFAAGVLPESNVKGKPLDGRMQPRCLQLILHNVMVLGYYLPRHGMARYQEMIAAFYGAKIARCHEWIEEYRRDPTGGFLGRAIGS